MTYKIKQNIIYNILLIKYIYKQLLVLSRKDHQIPLKYNCIAIGITTVNYNIIITFSTCPN